VAVVAVRLELDLALALVVRAAVAAVEMLEVVALVQ
jgi:hypothetical protein